MIVKLYKLRTPNSKINNNKIKSKIEGLNKRINSKLHKEKGIKIKIRPILRIK